MNAFYLPVSFCLSVPRRLFESVYKLLILNQKVYVFVLREDETIPSVQHSRYFWNLMRFALNEGLMVQILWYIKRADKNEVNKRSKILFLISPITLNNRFKDCHFKTSFIDCYWRVKVSKSTRSSTEGKKDRMNPEMCDEHLHQQSIHSTAVSSPQPAV